MIAVKIVAHWTVQSCYVYSIFILVLVILAEFRFLKFIHDWGHNDVFGPAVHLQAHNSRYSMKSQGKKNVFPFPSNSVLMSWGRFVEAKLNVPRGSKSQKRSFFFSCFFYDSVAEIKCVWTLRAGRRVYFHLLEVPSFGGWGNTLWAASWWAVSRLQCQRRQQPSTAPFGSHILPIVSRVCVWLSLSRLHSGCFEAFRE